MLQKDILYDYKRYRSRFADDVTSEDDGTRPRKLSHGLKHKAKGWFNVNFGVVLRLYETFGVNFHIYNIFNHRPYQPVVHTTGFAFNPYPRSYRIGVQYSF